MVFSACFVKSYIIITSIRQKKTIMSWSRSEQKICIFSGSASLKGAWSVLWHYHSAQTAPCNISISRPPRTRWSLIKVKKPYEVVVQFFLMQQILLTSWYGKYPIINKVLYIPGGEPDFFVSTVSLESLSSQCAIGNVMVYHTWGDERIWKVTTWSS